MKYLFLENFKRKDGNKIKKIPTRTKITIVAVVLIILILVCYKYISGFRKFMDYYILRKEIKQDNTTTMDVSIDDSKKIYAYDKYITILDKNMLRAYSSSAKQEFEIEVKINNPIYDSKNRFLCIAESGGQKIYLISGQNILWQKDIEGEISKINVNKNGYVSIVVTGSTHKSIVITYNQKGNELFKTYLATTTAIDIDISNDNKNLAIAEVDTTGTAIQSNIKIVSIEKAKDDPMNAVTYIYPASANQIITKIKYQDRNRLVCMYDDSIHIIENNSDSVLLEFSGNKVTFADIDIKDNVVKIEEKASGLFADTEVQLTNIGNKKENKYIVNGAVKNIYVYDDVVAVNLGSEVHFVSTNGWLIKEYTSYQTNKKIVLTHDIAAVVYGNKIDIISL